MRALASIHSRIDWTLENILIAIIIIGAAVGIAYMALMYFEIPIPPVVWKIIWVVLIATVAILAIRFLFTL